MRSGQRGYSGWLAVLQRAGGLAHAALVLPIAAHRFFRRAVSGIARDDLRLPALHSSSGAPAADLGQTFHALSACRLV